MVFMGSFFCLYVRTAPTKIRIDSTILAKFRNRGREVLAIMAHLPSQKREKSALALGYVISRDGASKHKKIYLFILAISQK